MVRTIEKTEEKTLGSKMAVESKLVKLTNILVGTDFSPASDRALEYACRLRGAMRRGFS